MKRNFILTGILAVGVCLPASGTIINIPDDYLTIQQGIDASTDGDTVLVQPGTYVENINFNGHNIVLGSLFLITGDTTYIAETIIDGDSAGSVVTFENAEDRTAIITGFTITNGLSQFGGGIYCDSSSPSISNNIIYGNKAWPDDGGGIHCQNNSDPEIHCNIISGNAAHIGGGINCTENSDPVISDNIIKGDTAYYVGGISCSGNSNAIILNNYISGNLSTAIEYAVGGGIGLGSSDPLIINNIIYGNRASHGLRPSRGGGISCIRSNPIIQNNTIVLNSADRGPGIYCHDSNPIITNTICRANRYNTLYLLFNGLSFEGTSTPTITYSNIIGGFTGEGNIDANPQFTYHHENDFNVCLQSPCIDSGDPSILDPDGTRSDIGVYFPEHSECYLGNLLHISTDGNDTTGNGTPQDPFRTVQYGVNSSLTGDTIIINYGAYFENILVRFKSIVLSSNYIYTLDTLDIYNTIINGDSVTSTILFEFCDSATAIAGLTVTNGASSGIKCFFADPYIASNNIFENISGSYGGGILCRYMSSPTIIGNNIIGNHSREGGGIWRGRRCSPNILNNIIMGNSYSDKGGGIYCMGGPGDAIISNNIIRGNSTTDEGIGGGISCTNTNTVLYNNVIYENSALYAGGVYFGSYDTSSIVNTIIWGNSAGGQPQIFASPTSMGNVIYSDIEGGWPGEGNIDIDPLFRDPENGDFHLMSTDCGDPEDSPCIDAGSSAILDSLLDCSWGLGTIVSDMGAYGGGDSTTVGINDQEHDVPFRFALAQNYPNPFNATTTLTYNLDQADNVTLTLYNILGQRVEILFEGFQQAGEHAVTWDASDYPSSVYLARLEAGARSENVKMVLLK